MRKLGLNKSYVMVNTFLYGLKGQMDAEAKTKSDPVSLDTVWTTMTAAKEAGHEGQGAKANHDSWQ